VSAKCAELPNVEYWVMRVMLHQGRRVQLDMMRPGAFIATIALVNTGDLVMLPDGSIAEPVEVFGVEMDAHARREKLMRDNPGSDYRVILNGNVSG